MKSKPTSLSLGIVSIAFTTIFLYIVFHFIDYIGKRALIGTSAFYAFLPLISILLALKVVRPKLALGVISIMLVLLTGIRLSFLGQGFYPITPFLLFSISAGFVILWDSIFNNQHKELVKNNPVIIPFSILILGAFLSLPFIKGLKNFVVWNIYALTNIFTSLILVYSFRDYKDIMGIGLPVYIAVSTMLISTVFILPPEYLSAGLIKRYGGIFGTSNRPGILASFSLFLPLAMAFYSKNKPLKFLYLSIVLLLMAAIIRTASRNAFFAMILGLWLFQALLLYRYKKNRFLFTLSLILTGIITILLGFLLIKHSKTLLLRISVGTRGDLSILTRFFLWKSTLSYIIKNPVHILIGNGPAQFYYYDFSLGYIFPHNVFIDFWFSFGILGLISLGILLFYTLKATLKTLKNAADLDFTTYAVKIAMISSLFTFWLTSLFDEVQWGIWGIEVIYLLVPYLIITFRALNLSPKGNIGSTLKYTSKFLSS